MKRGFFELKRAQKNLEANGLQEMINRQIAEGDEYCPRPGIFWVVWDDIIVSTAKRVCNFF